MSEIWIDIDTKKESRCYRLRNLSKGKSQSCLPSLESSCFWTAAVLQLLVPSRGGHVMNLCPWKAGQLGHRDLSTVCLLIS